MDKPTMYICFSLALSIVLTCIIAWITKQDKPVEDEEIYSTQDLAVIDADTKSDEIANMVSVYCPNIEFNFLREKIKSILKNEP
jgi:hypothetical protein